MGKEGDFLTTGKNPTNIVITFLNRLMFIRKSVNKKINRLPFALPTGSSEHSKAIILRIFFCLIVWESGIKILLIKRKYLTAKQKPSLIEAGVDPRVRRRCSVLIKRHDFRNANIKKTDHIFQKHHTKVTSDRQILQPSDLTYTDPNVASAIGSAFYRSWMKL